MWAFALSCKVAGRSSPNSLSIAGAFAFPWALKKSHEPTATPT